MFWQFDGTATAIISADSAGHSHNAAGRDEVQFKLKIQMAGETVCRKRTFSLLYLFLLPLVSLIDDILDCLTFLTSGIDLHIHFDRMIA